MSERAEDARRDRETRRIVASRGAAGSRSESKRDSVSKRDAVSKSRRIVASRLRRHTSVRAGAPGLGIAGFILSLLGISLLGLILSWIGLAQARREGRPTGMCMAGIIIGIAWMVLGVGLFLYSRSAAGF